MRPQFDHNVKTSFGLWLDNLILRKGRGFTNFTHALTKIPNAKPTNFDVFKSPHPQWVYDSSVTGASIPTSLTVNGSSTAKSDDVVIDFNNGRVLTAKSLSATTVSASYAFKEIAVYLAQANEQKLLFENKFALNPRTKVIEPVSEIENVYPAVYIQYRPGENIPYCFGGTDVTTLRVRVVMIMDSTFLFDGLSGILRDTVRTGVPYLEADELPFDKLGDFKDGLSSFNFTDLMAEKQGLAIMNISRVTISPFSEEVNTEIGKKIVAGFADFTLEVIRNPRN